MNLRPCSRLDEVRSALSQGHWPQACTADLRAHVEACSRCAEEILLTKHFQLVRSEAVEEARPGTPSLLWWRAQTRRRNAALTRAGRPLAAAQVFALVIVVAALVGFVASHWQSLLDRALSAHVEPASSLAALRGDWGLLPLVVAFGLVTALGGVVVYLTTERQ
ncbi:MAG TPA: hypothetical protein VF865_00160 [Acidobacteriaceae bacterium]